AAHRARHPSADHRDQPAGALSRNPECRETPTDQISACVRRRTDSEWRREYLVRVKMIPLIPSSSLPVDFTLAVHVSPGDTYEWSKVLLARAHFNGTLELLTAAWERVLGYGRQEFTGKTLRQLM